MIHKLSGMGLLHVFEFLIQQDILSNGHVNSLFPYSRKNDGKIGHTSPYRFTSSNRYSI